MGNLMKYERTDWTNDVERCLAMLEAFCSFFWIMMCEYGDNIVITCQIDIKWEMQEILVRWKECCIIKHNTGGYLGCCFIFI